MSDSLDVADLVARFVRLRDTEYADTRFIESGGVIDIDCGLDDVGTGDGRAAIDDVIMIRWELPGTEYLHLASVTIEATGLDDPIKQTTRTTSSVWKDYDRTLESGVIFDPERREKAFHTRKESHPWLEISLDRPRPLTGLRFRNCGGPNSVRAKGINVGVRTADGRYRTVYDGAAREREFARAVERLANDTPEAPARSGRLDDPTDHNQRTRIAAARSLAGSAVRRTRSTVQRLGGQQQSVRPNTTIDPAGPELAKVLTLIGLQDDVAVRWALERISLAPDQLSTFRSAVNQHLLFARERELTSHGIRRSFRFWSDDQVQSYLGFALEVVAALRELTPNVCFGFGSALAIVRDHQPIPHDDDMDLLIGFEPEQAATHTEGKQLVRECLQSKGFRVTGGMTAYQWVTGPAGGTRLDVFLGVFEGDSISWYPGKRGALTRSMMFPTTTREFLGRDCPIPAHPEDYLEQIYGPGWVRPDPGFRHRWAPEQYADIAGG